MRNTTDKMLSALWGQVCDELTLSQYEKTMGGDMSYKAKAEKALKVSRSETVRSLCIEMIQIYDDAYSTPILSIGVSNRDFSEFE
jgi:hypothetical protein